MSATFRRLILLQNIRLTNNITICRYFGKKTSDITKSIKSKWAQQKVDHDKSLYKYKTRAKIQNPSGYQHVKRQIRNSKTVSEVMQIMTEHMKCEDVQVGTAAIKTVKLLSEDKKVPMKIAMKHIDEIWNMMNKYVVGMDCAAYNEYFHACDLMRFERKCQHVFDQMIKNEIEPNQITLRILLRTCRRGGDTETALKYWKLVVVDMGSVPEQESWALFLAVCANSQNVQLAEECFKECPYKSSLDICYRMMSVYKNNFDLDKVLEMKKYISENNIEMDDRVYSTIADAYRNVKQWQQAIEVCTEAIS
eukprot:69371_1